MGESQKDTAEWAGERTERTLKSTYRKRMAEEKKRNKWMKTRGQLRFTDKVFVNSLVEMKQVTAQRWILNISFFYKPWPRTRS